MNSEILDILQPIARCISAQFGTNTEVVIHDFTKGFDTTIVGIENGHITGREIGGCPTTLFLEEVKSNEQRKENFRYTTHTSDGKILRSSTVNFHNDNNELIGSICINQDVTDMIQLEKTFNKLSGAGVFEAPPTSVVKEVHSQNVHALLESIISEAMTSISTPVNEMNKAAKLRFIKILDDKGVFLIQKSGGRICELLSISKFTLYNYLDIVRSDDFES